MWDLKLTTCGSYVGLGIITWKYRFQKIILGIAERNLRAVEIACLEIRRDKTTLKKDWSNGLVGSIRNLRDGINKLINSLLFT